MSLNKCAYGINFGDIFYPFKKITAVYFAAYSFKFSCRTCLNSFYDDKHNRKLNVSKNFNCKSLKKKNTVRYI